MLPALPEAEVSLFLPWGKTAADGKAIAVGRTRCTGPGWHGGRQSRFLLHTLPAYPSMHLSPRCKDEETCVGLVQARQVAAELSAEWSRGSGRRLGAGPGLPDLGFSILGCKAKGMGWTGVGGFPEPSQAAVGAQSSGQCPETWSQSSLSLLGLESHPPGSPRSFAPPCPTTYCHGQSPPSPALQMARGSQGQRAQVPPQGAALAVSCSQAPAAPCVTKPRRGHGN